jgi:hypothetical protein
VIQGRMTTVFCFAQQIQAHPPGGSKMRAAFHVYLDRSNGDAWNGSTMTPRIRSLIGR